MNLPNPPSQRLLELAHLPPEDPRRAALQAEIAAMDPDQREYWQGLLRENDQFHSQIGRVEMPAELESRLLSLPDSPISLPSHGGLLRNPWFHRLIAAAAIILITWIAYVRWPTNANQPDLLDDRLAMTIARQAVASAASNPPLELSSGNSDQILGALTAHHLPFPVMVLQPSSPLDLRGGGVCDFHGTPAAFTLWQRDGITYTLYQFDGKPLGVPAVFMKTTEIPKELWHDDYHPRVVVFAGAGGQCTWALVMDSDAAKDLFSGYY